VFPIRYIAVLGFQLARNEKMSAGYKLVSIRYIAVLGFQPHPGHCPLQTR